MARLFIANQEGTGASYAEPVTPWYDPFEDVTFTERLVDDPYRPIVDDETEPFFAKQIPANKSGQQVKYVVYAPNQVGPSVSPGIYDIGDPDDPSAGPGGMGRTLSNPEARSVSQLFELGDNQFFRGWTWDEVIQWTLENDGSFRCTFGDVLYEYPITGIYPGSA